MYGINNSYHEHGVVTFGRLELHAVLARAGFNFCEDYLPLPDYKLPVSVVTPHGWQNHALDLAPLAVESAHKDQQGIVESIFSLEQGINNIWHNGLAADLANSFLMVATQDDAPPLTTGIAAFHYSDSRLPRYRKATTFAIKPEGGLSVHAVKGGTDHELTAAIHHVASRDDFYRGDTLWFDLVNIINQPDWRLSDIGDWARSWIDLLLVRAGLPIAYERNVVIPNGYQDALPFNIIRQENGELSFFDQEWVSHEVISIAYIGFRGIVHSFLRISSVSYSQFYTQTSLATLALDVLNEVGFVLDKNDLADFIAQEARFLALIQQSDVNQLNQVVQELKMVMRAPSVEFLRLRANEAEAVDRATLQQNLERSADYERQLAQLQREIAEQATIIAILHQDMHRILHSSSWRISAPVRIIGRNIPTGLRRRARHIFSGAFIYGQAIKVNVSQALHGGATTGVSRPGTIKLKARKLAKSLYARAPQRYKGRLLKLAMRIRPGWFLHHPSFRPDVMTGDTLPGNIHHMGPLYISRDDNGKYHYAARPDEYNYIATEKPRRFVDMLSEFSVRPTFSIIVPIYNTPLDLLEKMVSSVRNQWYPDWELLLVNDASPLKETAAALDAFDDTRISVIHLDRNQGIAGATNAGIERAANDYIVFLDHDDELTDDCLFELAKCINADDPDFIYSDEDKLTPEGRFSQAHFKPDWSPDTMMGTMYTCHVACVRLSVARKLGGLRGEFNGCQDWDFVLRLTEITSKISHIPKVLYHWRIIPASCASDLTAKPYVLAASKAVRESALKRRGLNGIVEPLPNHPGFFRINYAPQGNPLISIIIPTRDNQAFLQRCVESILTKTRYAHFELVIVDNGSVDAGTLVYLDQLKRNKKVKLVRHDMPFNFSQLINVGVANAKGDLLLLLNDDTEALHDGWLERMAGYAQLAHIGAVGAKLLYGDGASLQHMGVLNLNDGPMHAYMRQPKDIPGYFMRNQVDYNWLAVTGACLMIERKKYLSIGGFDETFPVAYNDVDVCMSLVEAGLYNVVCQGATLIHHESISRGIDHMDQEKLARLKRELSHLYNKHPAFFQYDPFFNINLHPNGYCFEVQN
ncbi:glycosyltransferase [Enterobacteriales bacterium SAP-6]|uniref:Glycosyltransferase n=2 Tax=Acerihabitans arboris TaxID=2691583 RepID=A0A845SEL8_9GAMM|nr:glycosyltransferase [Acerihabitans arboris]